MDYRDEKGNTTRRIVWPLALIYYSETAAIVGWCELRQAIRNFRTDRIMDCQPAGERVANAGDTR